MAAVVHARRRDRRGRRARSRRQPVVDPRRLARQRHVSRTCGDGPLDHRRTRRHALARAGRVHGDRRVRRRPPHRQGRLAGASRDAGRCGRGRRRGSPRRRWSCPPQAGLHRRDDVDPHVDGHALPARVPLGVGRRAGHRRAVGPLRRRALRAGASAARGSGPRRGVARAGRGRDRAARSTTSARGGRRARRRHGPAASRRLCRVGGDRRARRRARGPARRRRGRRRLRSVPVLSPVRGRADRRRGVGARADGRRRRARGRHRGRRRARLGRERRIGALRPDARRVLAARRARPRR